MAFVKTEVQGAVEIITIDRPKALNALNPEVLADLKAAFEAVDQDTIRCIVLTGEGDKSFVAGADIGSMSTMTKAEGEAFGKLGNDVFLMIEHFPIPVIAAVNGFALGGGNELAMSCDIRICSDNAVFGQPEVGLGITPGFGGTQRLARLVGMGMAKQLVYSALNIKADEAYRIGLVNAVYPQAELMENVLKLANKIAIMYLGKIVEFGPAEDIFRHPRHPYTRALFDSIPTLTTHGMEGLRTLEGQIPSPINPPAGCAFHQRCPYATEACAKVAPQPLDLGGGHTVSCLRSTELEEALKETN